MKPTLSINHTDIVSNFQTLGMAELLSYLRDSGLFEIESHNERLSTLRGERATTLYYNDKKVFVDFWEYGSPTYTGAVLEANFDLIIKLQHRGDRKPEDFEPSFRKKNVLTKYTQEQRVNMVRKIVPWTFFPSRLMNNYVETTEIFPIERLGFFCGKMWRCRKHIAEKLRKKGIEVLASDQSFRNKRPLQDVEFMHRMKTSKYGIVLAGRASHFTEGKNRREMDYMILKKPLLLNYRPNYYNQLVEGKHFVYIDENIDFDKIEKMYNLEDMVNNAYQWYLENCSPSGAANVFLKIMKDKLGE